MKSTVSRIWARLALASVIGLAASPARWVGMAQLRMLVGIEAPQPDQPVDLSSTPLTHDRQAQVADAIDRDVLASTETTLPSNRWPRLSALQRRYPGDPAILGTLLRLQMGELFMDETEAAQISGEKSGYKIPNDNTPDFLNALIRETEDGERLEPENAYFSFLKAAVLFAQKRDRDALAVMDYASKKPAWNDYFTEECAGGWKLNALRHNPPVSLEDCETAQAALLPQDARLRYAAQDAAYNAMVLEQHGDITGGLRVRLATMKLGSLIRTRQASPVMTALVGNGIEQIAIARPAGAPRIEPLTTPKDDTLPLRRSEEFTNYLNRTGHSALAVPIREEIALGMQARDIAKRGFSPDALLPLERVLFLREIGILILQCLAMLVLFSVLARWIRPLAEGRVRRRAAYFALSAALGLLSPLAWIELYTTASPFFAFLFSLAVVMVGGGILIALFAPALRRDARAGQVLRRGFAVACLIASTACYLMFIARGNDDVPFLPPPDTVAVMLALWWAPLVVLPLFAAVTVIFCLARRIPLSSGVIGALASAGPHVACGITVCYAVFIAATNAFDQRIDSQIRYDAAHEVASIAAQARQPWPGAIDWSGVKP